MKKGNKGKHYRWVIIAIVIILVAGGLLAFVHWRHIHDTQQASGTIPTSKKLNSTSSNVNNQLSNNQTATNNSKQPAPAPSSTAVLIAPFGNFVSNHFPGQNNSPDTEESVCNTTPGASCNIQFTNASGTTKNLGAEVVNGNGTAYWSWTVNGATLASGSWQITAIATLNGQTKTTSDPMQLEVQ